MRLIAMALLLAAGPAHAETVDEIIDKARDAQKVDSSIQQVRMVLVSKSGAERVRELEMRVRKHGEIVKSYARFSSPTDVAGTQLVIVDNPDKADEQLLYLPALKRVNRIAGKGRSGSFMGSDFYYEDLELAGSGEATHTLLSENAEQWVIESVPGSDSSYSKMKVTVPKADYLPRKVEYFDKKGAPVKVMEVSEVARVGDVVIPTLYTMTNLQKGTHTRLEVVDHHLNVPADQIPDETFTAGWMETH